MVELGMVHNLLYCLSHHHHNQMDYLMLISTVEAEEEEQLDWNVLSKLEQGRSYA